MTYIHSLLLAIKKHASTYTGLWALMSSANSLCSFNNLSAVWTSRGSSAFFNLAFVAPDHPSCKITWENCCLPLCVPDYLCIRKSCVCTRMWVFACTCVLPLLPSFLIVQNIWATSWQNQQNDCTQWRLRSAWVSAQSDQSSLCAQWVAKDPSFLHADSEDWSDWADSQPDQSLSWGHMPFCWICHEAAQFILAASFHIITHICLVDPSILIIWMSPFPIFLFTFSFYSILNRYSC